MATGVSRLQQQQEKEAWESMLPGPPGRNNAGCSDCSPAGILAYGAGSTVVIADPRSMQLVCVLPMPGPPSSSLAPFVTAVRWTPQSISRDISAHDDPSNSHLRLAVGDRQGRIAIWDLRSRRILLWLPDPDPGRLGIQDLCWLRSDASWLLVAIHGTSRLALWDVSTGDGGGGCLWSYDVAPDCLSCLRRDPFDSGHLAALTLRGLLLSAIVLPNGGDVSLEKHTIPVPDSSFSELQRLERDSTSLPPSPASPAHVIFPLYHARFCFSPRWRHLLLVTFPKDLIIFDLQYGAPLFSAPLPRGCGKFMDVLLDSNVDLIYCVHLDGKLSIWKRKEGEQVHVLRTMEELMPTIGTLVPSPTVLSVILCQADSFIHSISELCTDSSLASQSSFNINYAPSPYRFNAKRSLSKTFFLSISDDGKIWNWLLFSNTTRENQEAFLSAKAVTCIHLEEASKTTAASIPISSIDKILNVDTESELASSNDINSINSSSTKSEFYFKFSLIGQLQLLSSTVTTLAVPSPSLIATLACGGNNPAPAVPLVALGTQNGTLDVIDVSANAVAVSFSAHSGIVRGLRWLGNSRLVSFSYSQVNDKGGGFTNRLVVTCLRSGLNRTFRVLQKPERASIRALRASSSGRYLLILFRDAPVEVWAMTKNPVMLRSLALPFTVLEWTLPSAPRPIQSGSSRQPSSSSKGGSSGLSAATNASSENSKTSAETSLDDTSESFAFALVNGALGVFELHGRRIRDFRPKWPSSSFVSSDGLITAMAYRLPHVVMGDRLGNIRWWDVTTGLSSSFSTHREGIRRIKFSPVLSGDRSRGRVAVLFYDNTFSIFDLDTSDPLANALLQPQSPGTLVLDLEWLPVRTKQNEPLVLCIAGADSSFRLIDINITDAKNRSREIKERFRPMPLCLPILHPTPHALALQMILQLGVKNSWFNSRIAARESFPSHVSESSEASAGDLRGFIIESNLPVVGDSVIPELLLKVLEPYRKEGCMLDEERCRIYSSLSNKSFPARLAFAAAFFGEFSEALFWLQLPHALRHWVEKSSIKPSEAASRSPSVVDAPLTELKRIASREKCTRGRKECISDYGQLHSMAFKQQDLWEGANARIPWHEKLEGEEAIQKRVHELVSVGNLESAVTLLLSTPPEGSHFYPNALRAVALSSAVSRSLHELAVKVVAANMFRTDKSLSGIHLLCAVGRYQEACSQLQDAGCWIDAATLAATHLHGSDYARILQRWAGYVLHNEHNIWRAMVLYVAAGEVQEAFAALRVARLPDTAAMFLLACNEINTQMAYNSCDSQGSISDTQNVVAKNLDGEDLVAISEFYGEYQRKLVHLCMDYAPRFD